MKTNKEINEHIKAIRCNWPDERYSMLCEALTYAIELMEQEQANNQEEKT